MKLDDAERARIYAEIVAAAERGEAASAICKRYGISRGMTSRIIRKSRPLKQSAGDLRRELKRL